MSWGVKGQVSLQRTLSDWRLTSRRPGTGAGDGTGPRRPVAVDGEEFRKQRTNVTAQIVKSWTYLQETHYYRSQECLVGFT